jgi:hypothetical protein
MSKLGKTDYGIERAIKIGHNNQRVISDAKKWCANLVVEDRSGGIVHEMYGLPMMQNIRCPHAAGQHGGMDFESSARDFIVGHCRGCKHHKEVSTPNFGRTSIEQYERHLSQIEQLESQKRNQKQKLFSEIKDAEKKAYPKTTTSQRSILELIYSLSDDAVDKASIAEKILEASKIAITAFNTTVLDFISLYFEGTFGGILLRAATNVASTSNISSQCKERILEAIDTGAHLDDAVGLLSTITTDKDVPHHEDMLKKIISTIGYPKSLSHPENQVSYPNTIGFIIRAHGLMPVTVVDAINSQLTKPEKYYRNNVNGLIQEIAATSPKLGSLFLEGLLNSLEFDDDSYWDSADLSTCVSICALFRADPERVQNTVLTKFPTMSLGARVEVYQLLGMIAMDETVLATNPSYSEGIVERLIHDLLNKQTKPEEVEKIMNMLSRITRDSVSRVKDHFDSLLGYLVDLAKKQKTFLWYRDDLGKPVGEQASFNPYRGMNYFDVHSVETALTRNVRDVESLLKSIIEDDEHSRSASILGVVLNLESDSDGKLKARLVGLLRRSMSDPLEISRILPNVYSFMLDHKSLDVRNEGLKLLNRLLEDFSSLVTHSFIDLVFVFLDDTQNLIKTRAIECLGTLCKVSPEAVGQDHVVKYLKLLLNNYKIIHQTAVTQVYRVFPLLTATQKTSVLDSLLILEKIYFEEGKDDEFCKELVEVLLFVTRGNEKQLYYVVSDRLLKYSRSKEYYVVTDALKKLTAVRSSNPVFSDLWLKEILRFLNETKPDLYSSFDDRADFFEYMHDLSFDVLKNNITKIEEFVKDRIQQEVFTDVFNMFEILSYFNLHESVKSLAEILESRVVPTKANEWVLRANSSYLRSANMEVHAINKTVNVLISEYQRS